MPLPNNTIIQDGHNKLIDEELAYDVSEMVLEHSRLYPSLTEEQKNV